MITSKISKTFNIIFDVLLIFLIRKINFIWNIKISETKIKFINIIKSINIYFTIELYINCYFLFIDIKFRNIY